MITIVNYGMGNLGSMVNMFKRIGVEATVESEPSAIDSAEKLILPGVGAFDAAMSCINGVDGLREVLDKKALIDGIPVLGVCLGMQLMTRGSEEGSLPGLGWIPADTIRFPRLDGLKVPHMGWNIATASTPSPLTANLCGELRYYFVHSYCVHADEPANSILRSNYGIEFDSGISRGHIYGVQFHPEKSHKFGMQILKNFADM